jgi:hypothetical protein
MPFDEEDNDQQSIQSQKVGLKKVSTQKSIFESIPKKPTQEDFENKVQKVQEKATSYKSKTADLAVQFNKTIMDKTLSVNKNMFQKEMEMELLKNMVKLAQDINSDPNEREGEGSLSWITLLLRTCFNQRDKINYLEHSIVQLEKKTDPSYLSDLISKEINKSLDKNKKSE